MEYFWALWALLIGGLFLLGCLAVLLCCLPFLWLLKAKENLPTGATGGEALD